MFTGLIEQIGQIDQVVQRRNYTVLAITADWPSADLTIGESVAVDGACLTVTRVDRKSFTVDVSQETLARSTLGRSSRGRAVNLERAMKIGERLGGHLVSGHIDATGTIVVWEQVGDSWRLVVEFEQRFDPLVISKGSIAINGISLTVNEERPGAAEMNLIPHTVKETTATGWKAGEQVNIEFDMIGKYIRKALGTAGTGLSVETLIRSGW